jgi:integrase
MARIDGVQDRVKLKARREPYWVRTERGCFLGYRKMTKGAPGTWVARSRDEVSGKQRYQSLGDFAEYPDHRRYDLARKAAEDWFKHLGMGGSSEVFTVSQVCERYVQHLRKLGRVSTADDVAARFRRWVYGSEIANIEIQKLRKLHLADWRQALRNTPILSGTGQSNVTRHRSDGAINRDMTPLRAALNLGLLDGLVTSSMAWTSALVPAKNADKRRDVYLDASQRQKLLEHADPALQDFLRGLCYLPLRPGALAALKVCNYDGRLNTLTVGKDKHGTDRRITVPSVTANFLASKCRGKAPSAPVFANPTGGHWNKDQWKGPLKAAAKAADLPSATTAYALRHSGITDLIQSGLDTLTTARISGTSIAMIEKHYGHLTQARARDALETLTF